MLWLLENTTSCEKETVLTKYRVAVGVEGMFRRELQDSMVDLYYAFGHLLGELGGFGSDFVQILSRFCPDFVPILSSRSAH